MVNNYSKKDIEILQLLLEDARISKSDMAKILGMPLSTLQKRLVIGTVSSAIPVPGRTDTGRQASQKAQKTFPAPKVPT